MLIFILPSTKSIKHMSMQDSKKLLIVRDSSIMLSKIELEIDGS
jgi:hypothetical protein